MMSALALLSIIRGQYYLPMQPQFSGRQGALHSLDTLDMHIYGNNYSQGQWRARARLLLAVCLAQSTVTSAWWMTDSAMACVHVCACVCVCVCVSVCVRERVCAAYALTPGARCCSDGLSIELCRTNRDPIEVISQVTLRLCNF